MTTLCKYCKTGMIGEFETLGNNRYKFFYSCPGCKSIYEGIREEKNRNVIEKNQKISK